MMVFQSSDVDDHDCLSGGARFGWFDPTEYAKSYFGKDAKLHGDFFLYLFRRFGPPVNGWDEFKEVAGYLLATEYPDLYLRISFRGTYSSFGYLLSGELESKLLQESQGSLDLWHEMFEKWCWEHHQFFAFYLHPNLGPKELKTVDLWRAETGSDLDPFSTHDFNRWVDQKQSQLAKLYEAINPRPPRQSPLVDGDLRSRVKAALIATIEDLARPVAVRDVYISAIGRVADDDPIIAQEVPRFKWAGYGVTHDYYRKFEGEGSLTPG